MVEEYDVVIVGTGPTGIFTAMKIVEEKPALNILMIEKGSDIDNRVCPMKSYPGSGKGCQECVSCAIVSGWGGAGAFSDGKLSLSADIGGNLEEYIGREELERMIKIADDIYLEFDAPERIFGPEDNEIQKFKDEAIRAGLKFIPARLRHLGTGHTKKVLSKMKDYLVEKGVEIRFKTKATSILVDENEKVKGIELKDGTKISTNYVSVAPGRENASWLTEEVKRLNISTSLNPVDIGVRVETPAAIAEPLTDKLYESKLIYQTPSFDDKVRTFCMSPYGEVVSENNQGLITVNGHSHADIKTENTNFALLVSKTFTEPFKEPITYGRAIAKLANLLGGGVLVQRLGDLLNGRRSTPTRMSRGLVDPTLKDATPGDLSLVLPHRHLTGIIEMLEALDELAPGMYSRDTLLYGVEVKFYSSRLEVTPNLETKIKNLFTGGDGAGITRGLMQASVAGLIIGREIISRQG
ncbi:FAD-dependent oxidoreductase [Halanaerobiaceae bacterium Z-7014]|uniref:FAD-dependent oxidoreductase n=1 Tax=Halonatronomonas betaini TaxID=2778430 RepID=A0A931B0C4_9FIRM|nr:FAD-dependent oxidoreductase [Halonatronomonas betaini]MBF8438083.1 FAD-dependent oxidoreductase [Halonatronomonas betaini]